MSSYKRLDRLCREIYPDAKSGISAYIQDMEDHPDGSFFAESWKDDYKTLKYYRWIRNRIAHEEFADEKNMCSDGDAKWLDNFYRRIINQKDPIAMAAQASKHSPRKKALYKKQSDIRRRNIYHGHHRSKKAACALLIIAVVLIFLAAVFFKLL